MCGTNACVCDTNARVLGMRQCTEARWGNQDTENPTPTKRGTIEFALQGRGRAREGHTAVDAGTHVMDEVAVGVSRVVFQGRGDRVGKSAKG